MVEEYSPRGKVRANLPGASQSRYGESGLTNELADVSQKLKQDLTPTKPFLKKLFPSKELSEVEEKLSQIEEYSLRGKVRANLPGASQSN